MKLGFVLSPTFSTILCTASLVAAEIGAQSLPVPSRNVVGYVKVTVARRGLYQLHYPMMPLNQTGVTVNDMMRHLPNGSSVIFWNTDVQSYLAGGATEVKLLGNWIPGTNNLLGKTFWLQIGNSSSNASFDIIMSGAVPDAQSLPTSTVSLEVCGPTTVNLLGSAYPVAMDWIHTPFAAAAGAGSMLMTYDTTTGRYLTSVKRSDGWDQDLVLQPGQGFWLNARGITNWIETKPYSYP